MTFVKAEPPVPPKNGTTEVASIRLFENGTAIVYCQKPPHAPQGSRRQQQPCKVLSFKDGGVLLQLPNWNK